MIPIVYIIATVVATYLAATLEQDGNGILLVSLPAILHVCGPPVKLAYAAVQQQVTTVCGGEACTLSIVRSYYLARNSQAEEETLFNGKLDSIVPPATEDFKPVASSDMQFLFALLALGSVA